MFNRSEKKSLKKVKSLASIPCVGKNRLRFYYFFLLLVMKDATSLQPLGHERDSIFHSFYNGITTISRGNNWSTFITSELSVDNMFALYMRTYHNSETCKAQTHEYLVL